MAYTTPRTWVADELVTASIMNTYIRDNQTALKSPPSDSYELNEGADLTTTSLTFADVSANFAFTITPAGSELMCGFHGNVTNGGGIVFFDVEVDDAVTPARVAGDDGIIRSTATPTNTPISFVRLITGLTPGTLYTVTLQWKVSAGTATLYAGAGTANLDVHPQFWVREVS